ncbi:MAG: FHA domain-containing protein [Planctomycetota bacterium]|nr:MAG: FHA domain-containing protein [Planctomycetota bacterium]
MYYISLEFQGQRIKTFDINKPNAVIGRELDCDVHIDNLGISRHHCKIEEAGGVHVLSDLNSNNGTYVKGQRIVQYNLNHGDEIVIGKYSLIYENPQQAQAVAAGPEFEDLPTMGIGEPATVPVPPPDPGGDVTMAGAKDAELHALRRAAAIDAYMMIGDRPYILQKGFYLFGKASDSDFPTGGFLVKAKEAIIIREETGYTLIPIGGKTRVNGKKMQQQYKLGNADILKVGNQEFTYFLGKPS